MPATADTSPDTTPAVPPPASPPDDNARARAQMPHGTQTILNSRSLATANRRLAELVRPGMTVLDVGCGTGAITRGIAEAVAPDGLVVGVDVNEDMIAEARALHVGLPCLQFHVADVHTLNPETLEGIRRFAEGFDIVTAARVLQWLAEPALAVRQMAGMARSGGQVLVLDYNHEKIEWEPEPPKSMRRFYAAFLQWRADAGMYNAIADRLAELFASAGLRDVTITEQHEVARQGELDFEQRTGIWAQVADTRGHQMVRHGYLTEEERAVAASEYRKWLQHEAQSQMLYLLAVEGMVP